VSREQSNTRIHRHIVGGKFLAWKVVLPAQLERDMRIQQKVVGVCARTFVVFIHSIGTPDGKISATLHVVLEALRPVNIGACFAKQECALLWPILSLVELALDRSDRKIVDRIWHLSPNGVSFVVEDNIADQLHPIFLNLPAAHARVCTVLTYPVLLGAPLAASLRTALVLLLLLLLKVFGHLKREDDNRNTQEKRWSYARVSVLV
jgi:hypothetical protein